MIGRVIHSVDARMDRMETRPALLPAWGTQPSGDGHIPDNGPTLDLHSEVGGPPSKSEAPTAHSFFPVKA